MPSVQQLEYIIAVHREKHFGRAAKSCRVAQPSLSAQIQKLEEELDVVVFDRSQKPIMTTPVGLLLIEQAKQIIREHQRLSDIALTDHKELSGAFHLGVIPTLAPYILPLFVTQFSKTYPNVQLRIDEYKTEDIIRLLISDELDAGLLVTPLKDERIIERHLFFEPFYVYAAKQHPLMQNARIKEKDLEHHDYWLLAEGHCFRHQMLRICARNHKESVLPNVSFAGGNLETLMRLIRQGHGYTLIPELAADGMGQDEVKAHLRGFEPPIPTREVSLIHSRSFLKLRHIETLEREIIAALPQKIRSLKRSSIAVTPL